MSDYVSVVLKFFSLGLVIAAGGFWTSGQVDSRPKYRDEQTLIGGAIWTQTIIPIGLIISHVINETLDVFMHAYFLLAGIVLLLTTGVVLTIGEYKAMHRQQNPSQPNVDSSTVSIHQYDRIYFTIGILTLLAGSITLADFIYLVLFTPPK